LELLSFHCLFQLCVIAPTFPSQMPAALREDSSPLPHSLRPPLACAFLSAPFVFFFAVSPQRGKRGDSFFFPSFPFFLSDRCPPRFPFGSLPLSRGLINRLFSSSFLHLSFPEPSFLPQPLKPDPLQRRRFAVFPFGLSRIFPFTKTLAACP